MGASTRAFWRSCCAQCPTSNRRWKRLAGCCGKMATCGSTNTSSCVSRNAVAADPVGRQDEALGTFSETSTTATTIAFVANARPCP
jgi:hypothetical protein